MIQVLYLGRVGYEEALRLQAELVALRQTGHIENVLLLLEHPPVLTLGRNAKRSNILASDELLAERGVALHEINRGGDVTYHGPGQLIGYPIFDLRSLRNSKGGRLGPVDFVRLMEEALIRVCIEYGIPAGRICGLTGVWCGTTSAVCDAGPASTLNDLPGSGPERKICAIGIHVSRGVVSHGFAFNVTTDMREFLLINPCGITDRPVTSLDLELKRQKSAQTPPGLEVVAKQAARQFGSVFGEEILALESVDALRAHAAKKAAEATAAPLVPGNDVPLQVPREVERLGSPHLTPKDHPANA
jgi:lipoyl(octanoyl) transferase